MVAKRRREEEEEDKQEEEAEKAKPKRAKLVVMRPTPKTHLFLHMKRFVDSYHSVSTAATPHLPAQLRRPPIVQWCVDRWGDIASRQWSASTPG